MLSIIIFLVLLVVIGIWVYSETGLVPYLPLLIIFILGSIFLLTTPFAGYLDEPIVEDTILIPINEGKESDCYLINTEEYYYTFKSIDTDNKYGVTEESTKTISGSNIKYFEEDGRTTGVLRKYTKAAKRNLFVEAFNADEVEYVFFVPKGSVVK